MTHNDYTYKAKCRNCGKIIEIWVARTDQMKREDFVSYCSEHSTFPIVLQCTCDNGSLIFHDVISYSINAI